jgi:diguanylate cyclase (GGDEF)-like protein
MRETVLIVDDSPTIRAAMSGVVIMMGLEPVLAESGESALELFVSAPPKIVLLDVMMPGIDGYETARRMRAASPDAWVPIIFLSSSEHDQDLKRAIECGGDDYLTKPVSAVVLGAKIRALQRLDKMHRMLAEVSGELAATNRRLEALSQQDSLTGLSNRRCFDSRMALHFAQAARGGEPLSVAICDVDHFKAYNDRYGHPAGDQCLRRVAAALAQACKRATDLAARYGGEEFALLLPDTPLEGALNVMEAARIAVATSVPDTGVAGGPVTLSAGVALWDRERDATIEALIARTDAALYRAKDLGRNRVVAS